MTRELTPEQVKAARALLKITQDQLAEMAGIKRNSVADFENRRRTSGRIYDKIYDALTDAGIEFSRGGARLRE